MFKIGLTQRVEVLPDRGERRDCLDQAWTHLLADNGFVPVPLPNRIDDVAILFDRIGLDGIIFTGGNDLAHLPGATHAAPERDAFERRLLQICTVRNIPVLGVCRGMQMLVDYYGGTITAVDHHVARRHGIVVQSESDAILMGREAVNSFHRYGVQAGGIPDDLRILAIAPDGTVEAVAHRRLPQWALMWHPERVPQDPGDVRLIRDLFGGPRS